MGVILTAREIWCVYHGARTRCPFIREFIHERITSSAVHFPLDSLRPQDRSENHVAPRPSVFTSHYAPHVRLLPAMFRAVSPTLRFLPCGRCWEPITNQLVRGAKEQKAEVDSMKANNETLPGRNCSPSPCSSSSSSAEDPNGDSTRELQSPRSRGDVTPVSRRPLQRGRRRQRAR